MDITHFKNKIKKNSFIAFGLVDTNNNMFKVVDDKLEFITYTTNFVDRIKELSYSCEVLIDQEFLQANNYKPVTDKTTYVLCDSVSVVSSLVEYKYRRNMKFIRKRDLFSFIQDHETRRSTPLFISLQDELMKQISQLIDIVEYIKIDRILDNDYEFKKFDLSLFNKSTKLIDDDTANKNNLMQEKFDSSKKGKLSIVLNGSMTITEKIKESSVVGFKYNFYRIG